MNFSFLTFFISTIGSGYFIYGKKKNDFHFLLTGLALIVYPFLVSDIVTSAIIGIILLILPFISRRYI